MAVLTSIHCSVGTQGGDDERATLWEASAVVLLPLKDRKRGTVSCIHELYHLIYSYASKVIFILVSHIVLIADLVLICLILPITYLWKLIKICFIGRILVLQKTFQQTRLEGSAVRDAEIFKKNVFCVASAWISGRLSGSQHEGALGCEGEMTKYHTCASFPSETPFTCMKSNF